MTDPEKLDKLMFELITSNRDLYHDVLGYQPIYLSRIKELMKKTSFTCSTNTLVDYLDRQVGGTASIFALYCSCDVM